MLPPNLIHLLSNPDLALDELARRSFYSYWCRINPKIKRGWWQKDAAENLQIFYEDLIADRRPMLVIEAPPQHGKSELIVVFISWLAGKHTELRSIYTSFSERLGIRANLKLQRLYSSDVYRRIFPSVLISSTNPEAKEKPSIQNRELIEYAGEVGYFRNTTVGGPITGEGLDLGIIDDPIKGREAANSIVVRDKIWDWFTDDFFTRFSESAGLLAILTRWHIDDPIGRLIASRKGVKVLKYPALAEDGAHLMDHDPRTPGSGKALFPEHKSEEFLLERKTVMMPSRWLSLYQQSPIQEGGGMFKVSMFGFIDALPIGLTKTVRYWDKAGTDGGGCNTAGVKMSQAQDGKWIISDVVKGQWSALERERRIRQTAEMDGVGVEIWIEQEPGSGGKESAEATVRNLAGFTIKVERVTGDKVERAMPYSAQVEAGNVVLLRSEWNKEFISEHEQAPNGTFKDQWDAAGGAFNKLAGNMYTLDNL
jgi:predicted phage terminase large subunit-like protein